MVVLSNAVRMAEWIKFMSDLSNSWEPLGDITKADLRAALDAVDDWVNNNMVSFNVALPLTARRNLTSRQKARLLLQVVQRRFEVE